MRARLLPLAFAAAVVACGCSDASTDEPLDDDSAALNGGRIVPPGEMPKLPLRTSGRLVVDAAGRRFKLVSVSWYGAESPDYVPAGLDRVDAKTIAQRIKQLGFNSVRLPFSNELVRLFKRHPEYRLAEPPAQPLDPNVAVVPSKALVAGEPALGTMHPLAIFDHVVETLTSEGLLVVLDDHTSRADWCCGESDGNGLWYRDDVREADRYTEAQWLEHWRFMARRYVHNPRVIGAELRNELRAANGLHPTWGDGDPRTDWHRAAKLGGDAVLSVAPNWLVFVGGLEWSQHFEDAGKKPLAFSVPNRLVWAPHEYRFFHGDRMPSGYGGYKDVLGDRWGFLLAQGKLWTAPVWVSEIGTCTHAPSCIDDNADGSQGEWFRFVRRYLNEADIDFAYWSINGTQSSQQPDSRRSASNKRTQGAHEGYGLLTTQWDVPGPTNGAKAALVDALMTMKKAKVGAR